MKNFSYKLNCLKMNKLKLYISMFIFLTFPLIMFSQDNYEYEKEINLSTSYSQIALDFMSNGSKLSGSLISPQNFSTVVVIVPGSGRDKKNSHYKLAESLLKEGIAVFRFDDRGVGDSEGKVTSLASDLSKDVIAAIKRLKTYEVTSDKKLGIIGHSLGGFAAISSYEFQNNIDFIILLATPIIAGGEFLEYQTKYPYFHKEFLQIQDETPEETAKELKIIHSIILDSKDHQEIRKNIKRYFKSKDFPNYRRYTTLWYTDLVKQDHEGTYSNLQIPLLYLIGDKDFQVNFYSNVEKLRSFNNENISVKVFEDLDHCLVAEGNKNIYDINERVLREIHFFLTERVEENM